MNLHFVRFIRGLQNFLAIPIMNTLAGFMIVLCTWQTHLLSLVYEIIPTGATAT